MRSPGGAERRRRLFLAVVVLMIVVVAEWPKMAEARRMCHTFFTCAPLILSVPLRDIVDASQYYSKTLLVISEISEPEWDKQMKLIEHLCHTWVSFDTCMERDWLDCIDWSQALTFLDMMAGRVQQVGVDGAHINVEAANHAREQFKKSHWTGETFRDAMDIATFTCQNIKRITPYMKCGRDLIMANETILNVTLRWRALAEAQCYQATRYDCPKVELMMKLLGHWLYHGCRTMTDELIQIIHMIFFSAFGDQLKGCQHVLANKTTTELFEKPLPPEAYEHFGDDLSNCNMEAVGRINRQMYDGTVVDYLKNHNMSKPQFFDMMQLRLRNGGLVVSTTTTPEPATTTTVAPSFANENFLEESTTKKATARYGKRRRTTTQSNDEYSSDDDESGSLANRNSQPLVGLILLPLLLAAAYCW